MLETDDEKEGGSVLAAINLATACDPHTPQTLVIGARGNGGESLRCHELTVIRTKCVRGFGSAFMPNLRQVLDHHHEQIGLLHINGAWSVTNIQAMRWAHRREIPVVWTVHNQVNAAYLAEKALKKRLYLTFALPQFRRAVRCVRAITIQEQVEIGRLGLPCDSVVVPNGVKIGDPVRRSKDALLAKISGVSEKRVLLFVGRISPEKGILELIEAFSACQAVAQNWVLVIAGAPVGASKKWLAPVMQKMSATPGIHYLGHWPCESIADLYRAADCLVLPSHSEVRSLVVLEACAFEIPSIITEECHFSELCEEGGGIMVSRSSLQADLAQVLAMPSDELIRMGQIARNLVVRNFSWSKIGKEMSDVYQRYL